jgi:hypothetical protein
MVKYVLKNMPNLVLFWVISPLPEPLIISITTSSYSLFAHFILSKIEAGQVQMV